MPWDIKDFSLLVTHQLQEENSEIVVALYMLHKHRNHICLAVFMMDT